MILVAISCSNIILWHFQAIFMRRNLLFLHFNKKNLTQWGLLSAIITICTLIVIAIFLGINQFRLSSQFANNQQTNNLSHIIVKQEAKILAIILENNSAKNEINNALKKLEQQQFVINATVYNTNGSLLAQSSPQNIPKTLSKEEIHQQQIVEPISNGKKILGFLRVTFDANYGADKNRSFNDCFSTLYAFYIIIVLATILLASSIIYVFRHLRVNQQSITQSKLKRIKHSRARAFHIARRRFRKH